MRVTPESLGTAMHFIRNYKAGKLYDCKLTRHYNRRSLDANAMAWSLMGQMAAKIGVPDVDIYREYIPYIGDNSVIVEVKEDCLKTWDRVWCGDHKGRKTEDLGPSRTRPGYHNVQCYVGSSDFNSEQMSRLLDLIIEDCKACGVEYLSERERTLLLDEWGEKYG